MPKLSVYSASAGSGKTFRLTLTYLEHLCRNPWNYRKILAVTFTNKATEEMKSRVVKELYHLANGLPSNYLQLLCNETSLEKAEVKKKAELALSLVLHDYSRFSVLTIEAFFQRVIKAFVKEIGLQAAYRVELNQEKILSDAINKLLSSINEQTEIKDWLIRFANTNIDENKNWKFHDQLEKLGKEIFKEDFKTIDKQSLDNISDKAKLKSFQDQLIRLKKEIESVSKDYGTKALQLYQKYQLTADDFSQKSRGVGGYFVNLANKGLVQPNSYVLKAIDNPESWYSNQSRDSSAVLSAYNEGLGSILTASVNWYNEKYRDFHTATTILSNLYSLGLLADISGKVREFCREKNIFLLADAPGILNALIDGNDTPFIYEKIGSVFQYFMIDEFQDTSTLQWRNFLPLIQDSLANGHENLIVGDVKQSIYRWRNSDWSILAGGLKEEFHQEYLDFQSLSVNRRSKKVLVQFNNDFLTSSTGLVQNELNQEIPGNDKHQLEKVFIDHLQQTPGNEGVQEGFVGLFSYPANSEEENFEMKWVVRQIEELQDHHYLAGDIAILVRKKNEGTEIARYLMDYKEKNLGNGYNYSVISSESLLLTNSPAIRFIIGILKYYIDPADKQNIAKLSHEYARNIMDDEEGVCQFFNSLSKRDDRYTKGVLEVANSVADLPLYDLVEQLIQKYQLGKAKEEHAYLQAFQNELHNYLSNYQPDIFSFINWWEDQGCKISIDVPGDDDAIRILTIHKSKGLEFDAVILPFCSWDFDDRKKGKTIWCTANRLPFDQLGKIPVSYGKSLDDTWFATYYHDEIFKSHVDNLNLLYVAMTRAKEALFMLFPDKEKPGGKGMKSIADLLKKFAENTGKWNDDEGKLIVGKLPGKQAGIKKPLSGSFQMEAYLSESYNGKLMMKFDHAGYFDKDKGAMDPVNDGKIMHEAFSVIETADDIEKAVNMLYNQGKIDSLKAENLKGKIANSLSSPEIKDWFSGNWKVVNERDIITGSGELKRPDRVMIRNEEAIVVDYKFGNVEDESHERQVRQYAAQLNQMGYKTVKARVWHVELGKLRVV